MRKLIKHTKHGFRHKPYHMSALGVLLFGFIAGLLVGIQTITSFADPEPLSKDIPPSLSGTEAVGQTMTTTNGTWGGSPTSYTYQWLTCDASGNNCTNISGATSQTYVLQVSDSGKTVRTIVTAHNDLDEELASDPSDPSDIVQAQFGDLNADGIINLFDLGILLGKLNCNSSCGSSDLDSNGTVEQADLDTLLGMYHP